MEYLLQVVQYSLTLFGLEDLFSLNQENPFFLTEHLHSFLVAVPFVSVDPAAVDPAAGRLVASQRLAAFEPYAVPPVSALPSLA